MVASPNADASVTCGEPIRDPDSPTHVTNPSVVVEVLSSSTEEYDRGEKRSTISGFNR
jgi:Uma2 family endonuclease